MTIGLKVAELERHKINMNTKEKHIIRSILNYIFQENHQISGATISQHCLGNHEQVYFLMTRVIARVNITIVSH